MIRTAASVAIVFLCGGALAADITLRLPLACDIGKTCFVQNYVDNDPTSAARDFTCGTQTYDAHNGVDFRLPTTEKMKQGVAVLAAADGLVMSLRDGMSDVSVREIGVEALKGQDCGNGVVIRHTNGFETQYCHMLKGSIAVRQGMSVKAGDTLGRVGMSGRTEYAHLHFTLRHSGQVVDPFAYGAPAATCGSGASLWDEKLRPALAYRPGGTVLNRGFADKPVTLPAIDSGDVERMLPSASAEAIVAYVRAISLRKDDVLRISVTGPDGKVLADNASAPLDNDKAQYFMFAGRKRPPEGWKSGNYRATFSVRRGNAVVLEESFETQI